ncbi:MAG TPA: diguanylate cyclase [Candidatus Omnitrophica bacterium]|nr:diguanylate cyclase [Candidatus Omnitrophota bacterium]
MKKTKMNIVLIGARDMTVKFRELFSESKIINILGVLDLKQDTKDINTVVEKISGGRRVDSVVNISGDDKIQQRLLKIKSLDRTLLSNHGAGLLREIFNRYVLLEDSLKKAEEELDVQTWGLGKTNESIRILYKELDKKNQELKRLDKVKSDFIFIVSHELRTPLSTMNEAIGLIIDEITGKINQQQKSILIIARQNLERLTRLINNLLDISKIEAGNIALKKKAVDVKDIVKEVVYFFEPKAKSQGLELKANVPKEKIEIYADKDKITQVFTNLVNNALKFTKEGFVQIDVCQQAAKIECAVLDTGIGISKDDLPRIFGKFQQFGRIEGEGEKGTGLGLAISKGVIEAHGGSIRVDSELGKWTKISFLLPRYSTELVFRQALDDAVYSALESQISAFIIVVRMDDFLKMFNKLGQQVTQLMTRVEQLIKSSLYRRSDLVVSHFDEIAVFLSDVDKKDVLAISDRFKEVIQKFIAEEKLEKDITFSLGMALCSEGEDADSLLRRSRVNLI